MKDINFCGSSRGIYVDGVVMGDDNVEIEVSFCDRHKSMQNHMIIFAGMRSVSVCLKCCQEIALVADEKLELTNDSNDLKIKGET